MNVIAVKRKHNFEQNYGFQEGFFQSVTTIVGPRLIRHAPIELDRNEATDFMILRGGGMSIACRIRRYGYADKYPFDVTIRETSRGGGRTELQKIKEGFADCLFYGHQAKPSSTEISRWFLVCLRAWRFHWGNQTLGSPTFVNNTDGTRGVAYDLRNVSGPPSICIDSSHKIPASEMAVGFR